MDEHKIRSCRDCKKLCAVGGRNAICKDCKRLRTDIRRKYICDYLSRSMCTDCGERDIVVLEFDHVKGEKKRNISTMVNGTYSIKAIEEEIEKCEVVCSNCHRRRTAERSNQYRWRLLCP